MHVEELHPELLAGWFVVEVGRRQVWPFVTLADPSTGEERRLFIDTTFSVTPDATLIEQHDDAALTALIAIENQTVTSAHVSQHAFHLALEDCTLIVSAEANGLTAGSPWWIGNGSATG
jgi:hypothetical protein